MKSQIKSATIHDLFMLWSAAFILGFIPLDILYRIDTLIRYSEWASIIVDISVIILFFVLIALTISLVFTLIGSVMRLCGIDIIQPIMVTNVFTVVLLLTISFIRLCKIWFIKVAGIDMSINPIPYRYKFAFAMLILIITIIYRKKITARIGNNISQRFTGTTGTIKVIVVLCATVVLVRIMFDTTGHLNKNPLEATRKMPNVILVTFDALRAEDMSLFGYHLKTTPYIEKFAGESYVFSNLFASSNWTKPSVASILSGLRPSTHRLISMSLFNTYSPNSYTHKNLANYLGSENYKSIAIVSNIVYAHPYGNDLYNGFDEMPFDTIDPDYISTYENTCRLLYLDKYFTRIRSTANRWIYAMINDYCPWLKRSLASLNPDNKWNHTTGYSAEIPFGIAEKHFAEGQTNRFYWIHIFLPHYPYLPPKSFKYQFLPDHVLDTFDKLPSEIISYNSSQQEMVNNLRLRYDENILYADASFGEFLEKLRKKGLYDTSIIILTSDHGESFDHGYFGHGGPYLYQQLVHVPLIIHMPGQRTGKIVPSNMEHIDIAPTLVDLLGLKIPPWFEGESMMKAMYGNYISAKPKYMMNIERNSCKGPITTGQIAVVQDDFKYIFDVAKKKEELFNLHADRFEQHNLIHEEKDRARLMRSFIEKDILNK